VEGPFLKSGGPTAFIIGVIDNVTGYAAFGCIIVLLSPFEFGVTGSGTLATITFHLLGEGDTDLHLYDTKLMDSTMHLIPHDTVDGFVSQFSGQLSPVVSFFPHEIYLDEQTRNFTLSVNIENLQASHRLVGVSIRLEYDTTILNFVSAIEGGFLKDFEKYIAIDTKMFPLIGILLLPPHTRFPEGNGSLVVLSFEVTGLVENATMHLVIQLANVEAAEITPPQNDYCHILRTWDRTDLNCDEKVNVLDLSIFAKAFATRPGQYRWNTNVDIDRNQVIDIVDATIIAMNFGKTPSQQ
jgi:hypothetical protein